MEAILETTEPTKRTCKPDVQLKEIARFDRRVQRCVISKAERDLVLTFYPEAKEDPLLLRYLVYVLFCPHLDVDDDFILIGKDVLRWITNRPLYKSYSCISVLNEITDRLPDFRYYNQNAERGKCRRINIDGINPALRQQLRVVGDFCVADPNPIRVFALDGSSYSERRLKARVEAVRKDALHTSAPSETAERIHRHMNDVPSNSFKHLQGRVPELREALREYAFDGKTAQTASRLRDYYTQVVENIALNPQPIYSYSGKGATDRIFGDSLSVLVLPRELRKVALQDYTSVDLCSAQAAIAGALWGCVLLKECFADPRFNLWRALHDYMADRYKRVKPGHKPPPLAQVKDAYKTLVYSIIFGMEVHSLKFDALKGLGKHFGREMTSVFFECPYIAELLERRELELKRIEEERSVWTPTGIIASMDEGKEGSRKARQVLSTLMQSYEQAIMSVLVEYQEEYMQTYGRADFRIMFWIHDGCYLHFVNRNRKANLAEMKRRVEERSRELLGIPVFLGVE